MGTTSDILKTVAELPLSEQLAFLERVTEDIQERLNAADADSRKTETKAVIKIPEMIVNLHIEKLPEGVYLATSDNLPGLIAQADTVAETIRIAEDVAKHLLRSQREKRKPPEHLVPIQNELDIPLVVGI